MFGPHQIHLKGFILMYKLQHSAQYLLICLHCLVYLVVLRGSVACFLDLPLFCTFIVAFLSCSASSHFGQHNVTANGQETILIPHNL